ncbi:hypothetical protein [Amaricoccus sp.]|uniref:hypothetical protein n=1 Tax=Amaricoccus sp. TaxID=1872485 RepID=UPI00262F8B86|nr:hypothetical protein [Amaricoccus sp.]HRO09909.1 hypothetical protein [Amaricoccus sp.]
MKNPWMSLWLSAANRTAGTARGLWTAEARRQQQAFAKEMTRAWGLAPAKRKKPARKRPGK